LRLWTTGIAAAPSDGALPAEQHGDERIDHFLDDRKGAQALHDSKDILPSRGRAALSQAQNLTGRFPELTRTQAPQRATNARCPGFPRRQAPSSAGGTLDLTGVTVQSNIAQGSSGTAGQDAAGGIWSSGWLTLEGGTLIQDNQAGDVRPVL
jgi:hypothetical protein